jgi:hypothetical protein
MKKAILLIAVVALSACQTTPRQEDGKRQADKIVRAVFGTVKPLQADPNCRWCLVKQRCKVPSCPNALNKN